jgi:hypothetical protein
MKLEKISIVKTFKSYYKLRLAYMREVAKADGETLEECLKRRLNKTPDEYREYQLKIYERKECRSFWRRECTNKDVECHHCRHFYSISDWDKMTAEERENTL